jgi:hypothetical protein
MSQSKYQTKNASFSTGMKRVEMLRKNRGMLVGAQKCSSIEDVDNVFTTPGDVKQHITLSLYHGRDPKHKPNKSEIPNSINFFPKPDTIQISKEKTHDERCE